MNEMLIYKAEAGVEGLAEKIIANRTIAYHAPIQVWEPSDAIIERMQARFKAEANAGHFQDLFPTKSILASTSWNRNDDVFLVEPTWAARHTPVNKPTNLEHDEKQIVGHMTDTWVINEDGSLIANDTLVDDLPELFHLCNGAVIYKTWSSEELEIRTRDLIEKIQAGEMFVSMECLFTGFNYAVQSPNGDNFVIARGEESAFLTKHLRAYGGTGEYDNHRIGRAMLNFSFSGKGYVETPANPDSIIFNSASVSGFAKPKSENPFDESAGVFVSSGRLAATENEEQTKENNSMSGELNMLQSQLDEAKAQIKAQAEVNKELSEKLAQADVAQYETTINDLREEVNAQKDKADEDKKKMKATEARIEELEAQLADATAAKEAAEATIAEAKAAEAVASRVSTLVDGGIDKSEAEAKVETFAGLDNDQFAALAAELIAAAEARSTSTTETAEAADSDSEEEDADDDADSAEGNASEEVLEDATANDEVEGTVATTEEDNEDELTIARKGLASFVSDTFGIETESSEDSE